jgi:hypothetical protein
VAPFVAFHTLLGFVFELLRECVHIADIDSVFEQLVSICNGGDSENGVCTALPRRVPVFWLDPSGFLDHLGAHSVDLFNLPQVCCVAGVESERDPWHHDWVHTILDVGVGVEVSGEGSLVGQDS